ncbi:hypothetical protein ACLOJK_021553 [Asimina triloba]
MDFEVRVVGGMESCFVSLPLPLIRTLQSTHMGFLPPILALELRPRRRSSGNDDCWHLAWSGSASTTPAIEVSQQLAECISLPDSTLVQVKAIANLPRATLVTIEPSTEDDWEILELNSELAEEAILKQVGIVYEGMRFPLWVHGHTVIVFSVVSTSPRKSVGAEVAVAPKRRQKDGPSHQVGPKVASIKESEKSKALLRVQAQNERLAHRIEVKGVELGVMLTSAAFIHPETAKDLLFDNLQLVIVLPRLTVNNTSSQKNSVQKSNLLHQGVTSASSTISNGAPRHVIVRLLLSDSVARGHIMLPPSLCLYLRAGIHSWVFVKRRNAIPNKSMPSLTLSPCRFKFGKNKSSENGLDTTSRKVLESKSTTSRTDLVSDADVIDWSFHEEVISFLSSDCPKDEGKETLHRSFASRGNKCLINTWFIGQLEAIRSFTGAMDVNSVALGTETLVHIQVSSHKLRSSKKEFQPVGTSPQKIKSSGEAAVQLLFILQAKFEESSHDGQHDYFELAGKAGDTFVDHLGALNLMLGELDCGEPASFDSVKERSFGRSFRSTISSLSWMEPAISDVINRLIVLLSPDSGKFFSSFDLPLPGHVLIYGPSLCLPGSGKTSLAMAVAKYLEEHEEILAHIVFVSGSKLAIEKALTIRQAFGNCMSEALDHSPSLIILDDLDSVVSSSAESEGSQLSVSSGALVEFIQDIIDEYGDKRLSSCGIGPIALMASVKSISDLPQSLCSSGRFDFHVQLPAPTALERRAILNHEIHKRSLESSEDILLDIASKCDGYDAYDLTVTELESIMDGGFSMVHVQFVAQAIELIELPSMAIELIELPSMTIDKHMGKRSAFSLSVVDVPIFLMNNMMSCQAVTTVVKEILVDRAVHAATGRYLSCHATLDDCKKPILMKEDFLQAMHEFLPVAMRGVTKSASEGGRTGWDDVGGLSDIRNAIQEMVELPSKFPDIFAHAPLRLRSNILLYGPPGCGKTHIVGAAAAACSLRFISVKGPELLNKYIGASEQAVSAWKPSPDAIFFFQGFKCLLGGNIGDHTLVYESDPSVTVHTADIIEDVRKQLASMLLRPSQVDEQLVRDIFSKASAAAPCLLFFDEFDSIAPKRGHDNTGVTDRVVNQLLTELDGVEALTGVFVFAATSRPDLLDAALLRPGRLDRLLFCDFPSWHERLDILTVLSRKLPLASNVDLEAIASVTEGFSGADLQALLSDAQLASVHELLESGDGGTTGKKPVISDVLLKSVAAKARPSVSDAEKKRLYSIYYQLLDSKKSIAAQKPQQLLEMKATIQGQVIAKRNKALAIHPGRISMVEWLK